MNTETSTNSFQLLGEIHCLHSYLKMINKIKEKNDGKLLAYRGHNNKEYKLVPSIGRIDNYSKDKELDIFYKFCSLYHSFTDLHYDNDMDLLFLAQHYGLPTRLLDWTLNPLIGLFFACYSKKDEFKGKGEVIINVVGKNKDKNIVLLKKYRNESPFSGNLSSLLIIPDYTDSRLMNQSAAFTIFNNPTEIMGGKGYRIRVSHKQTILKELSDIGIRIDYVYPTLDKLCERLKSEIKK